MTTPTKLQITDHEETELKESTNDLEMRTQEYFKVRLPLSPSTEEASALIKEWKQAYQSAMEYNNRIKMRLLQKSRLLEDVESRYKNDEEAWRKELNLVRCNMILDTEFLQKELIVQEKKKQKLKGTIVKKNKEINTLRDKVNKLTSRSTEKSANGLTTLGLAASRVFDDQEISSDSSPVLPKMRSFDTQSGKVVT